MCGRRARERYSKSLSLAKGATHRIDAQAYDKLTTTHQLHSRFIWIDPSRVIPVVGLSRDCESLTLAQKGKAWPPKCTEVLNSFRTPHRLSPPPSKAACTHARPSRRVHAPGTESRDMLRLSFHGVCICSMCKRSARIETCIGKNARTKAFLTVHKYCSSINTIMNF